MPFSSTYNMEPVFNWDGLAAVYMAVGALWTLILACGLVALIINRNLPFIRIRNVPLSVSAVATLHVYWCLCITAYTLNGNFPCGTEFWIMSIYLPLGVALYQASNTQLLYIAGLQQKFAYGEFETAESAPNTRKSTWRRLITWWSCVTSPHKAVTGIAIGMVLQFVLTLTMFLISRMFHPRYGIVGHPVDKISCRRGWQWIPSMIWQFTWAWIYAPYLLWRIRKIDDVHGWRLQTLVCSIAGLMGSPLWLIALYSPAFRHSVNHYCPPPLWFTPGIAVMEFSLVFMPLWQVLKHQKLKKETLDIIAEWEDKQAELASIGSGSTKATRKSAVSHRSSGKSTTGSRRGEMYTMQALEKALHTNPHKLLLFAAEKDFSGENIGFLSEVQNWKRGWTPTNARSTPLKQPAEDKSDEESLRRRQFTLGVRIYAFFVCLKASSYPINLSSAHYKELEAMFDGAAALANASSHEAAATPFNSSWSSKENIDAETLVSRDGIKAETTTVSSFDDLSMSGQQIALTDIEIQIPSWVRVPDEFGPMSFDNAEQSIKYMVLTNTWPKFVADGLAKTTEKKTKWQEWKALMANLQRPASQG